MGDRRCKGRSYLAVFIQGLLVARGLVIPVTSTDVQIAEGITLLSMEKARLNEPVQIKSEFLPTSAGFQRFPLAHLYLLRDPENGKTEAPRTSAVRNLFGFFITKRNQKSLLNTETQFWKISEQVTPRHVLEMFLSLAWRLFTVRFPNGFSGHFSFLHLALTMDRTE